MSITHVPLLKIERDIHDIPRGMERFATYLKTVATEDGDDVRLVPLLAMNPMGREHVSARLDELLSFDADAIAAEAIDEALTRLGDVDVTFEHGLAVLDDIAGGWTNRTVVDATYRTGYEIPTKRCWLTTGLWVSEKPTPESVRQAVLLNVARFVYILRNGVPKNLRQILQQEGEVSVFAGVTVTLDAEELDYSRHVIAPYLDTTDFTVYIAALYGNNAAISLGYPPLGLSDNAGIELALANVLAQQA